MNAVAEAKRDHVRPLPIREDVSAEYNELRKRRQCLLGVEAAAKSELDRRINLLEVEVRQADMAERCGFPVVSFQPLRWRSTQTTPATKRHWWEQVPMVASLPLPKLAVLTLDDATFTIVGGYDSWGRDAEEVGRRFPAEIVACYQDVCAALTKGCGRDETASLSFTFRGVIPDSTRAKITEAKGMFQAVYLLAEAQPEAWRYERHEAPVIDSGDPLVVGFSAGAMWLIDSFDPTAVEAYVATEFTR